MVFSRNAKRQVVHLQRYDLTIDIEMATADRMFAHLEATGEDLDQFVGEAIDSKLRGGAA